MRPLCTLGLALWPDTPHQDVTAVTLCRQLARIATGGSDGSIWLWQGPSYWHPLAKSRVPPQQPPGTNNASQEPAEERIRPLALLLGQHENAITSMTCSYDGTSPVLVSADSAGTLCVWRLEDGVCLRRDTPPHAIRWDNLASSRLRWMCDGHAVLTLQCIFFPVGAINSVVVDILGMKRVVRLFGHGEWCIDLCARNMDSVLEEELGSKAEPTVYSIDRGGTLCCWLADRSCTHAVIGWTPTVQVSEVPISFPRSLSLDPLSSALLVVGLGGSVLYKIGADHRLDGKQGAHLVVDINDRAPEDDSVHKLRLGLPHQASEGGTDPPEQRRRRRHASRAFIPKNAIRQWSSAPPEDFGEALAAQEAGETARLTQSTDTDDDAASARSGTGTAKGWLKAKGSLSPGGDRAVVWVDGVGMYAVSFAGGRGGELLGVDSGATDLVVVGGDSGGWLLGVTAEGKLHVWRPVSASKAPAGDMGGAAALKLRARQAAGLEGDASPCSPAGEPAKSRDRGPEGLHELLERDWVYEQGATLSDGFSWAASSRAARGETTTTVTAALVQIEAARPLRWFLGDRSGGVKVMSLPSGRELHALGGEGVAVRSMLCVPGSDTLLVGSDDGVVAAWHVGEQRRMYAFRQHVGAVRRLVWLGAQLKATMRHGNVFCSIGADRHVMVATTQSTDSNGDPGGPAVLYLLGGHSSEIKEVMWAERLGCVCVVTGDGGAHLWQLRDRGGADCIRRVAPALVPAVLSALQRSSGGGPVLHSEAACAEPEDGGEGEDV
ncbi:WD40-repeat-containing domain protein, partial [Baffinella frigidus]